GQPSCSGCLTRVRQEHRRMTRLFASTVLIAAFAAAAAAQSTSSQLADTGWQALRNGDGDRAASAFGEALTLSPRDPALHLGAGAAAHLLGRESDAIRALQRAVALDPGLVQALTLLGEISYRQGDVDLAIRSYERALA